MLTNRQLAAVIARRKRDQKIAMENPAPKKATARGRQIAGFIARRKAAEKANGTMIGSCVDAAGFEEHRSYGS